MIPLPKLLNSSGAEVRRIRPVSLSIVENIIPLSTASLTIRKEDAFPDRSYLELYNANGSAGVYRARTPDTSYRGNTITIGLEHAVCEIGDFLVRNNGEQEQKTLSAALTHFMSYYSGSKWQLGSVSVSGNVVVQDGYQDILSAINGAVAQVPGAMLAYNFSTSPWTLSVVSRGTTVSAEGRLSRNIEKCNVKRDDSSLFTRVWVEGLGGEGVTGHMDADTLSTYGVIETQLGGNNYTQAQAQTVARAFLERHKRPVYSITIDGLDFSGITGEALDRVALGKLYRLAIPEDNVTIEEHITSIRWTDVYDKPYAINLTLAEQDNSSIRFLQEQKKQEQSNYQSLYNGYTSSDSKLNGKIDDTKEDVDWVWRKTGIDSLGEEETLMTRIQINAEGIQTEVTRASTAEGQLSSRITQNADSITAEVTRATAKEGTLSSRITQTAESITAEVTRATTAEGTLSSRITQTAESITAEVTRATESEGQLSSRITQTAESIQSEVSRATAAEGTLSSRIAQNAESITLEVQRAQTAEGQKYSVVSGISITSDGITISGSKYLTLTSGGTFSVNSGNFSVNDQGELRASKLITVAEDGTETVVNMKNWPFWKLNYATVKSIDTSGGTLTIVTTAGSYSFNGAATVTLSGNWGGSTFTVSASNGKERAETFSAGTGLGNQSSGGQYTISSFNSSHKAYGYVNASSLPGSRLFTFNVDASSVYDAGYKAGFNDGLKDGRLN